MNVIWKYNLAAAEGVKTLDMPAGAKLCHIGPDPQTEMISIWFMVDPTKPAIEKRVFRIYDTGDEIEESEQYVGSCRLGIFMFHVFEVLA